MNAFRAAMDPMGRSAEGLRKKRFDDRVKVGVLLVYIIDGGGMPFAVGPLDSSPPVRLEPVIRPPLSRLGKEHREPVPNPVSQKNRVPAGGRINAEMVAGKAPDAEGGRGHIRRDLRKILIRMLQIAKISQILGIGSVGLLAPGSVYGQGRQGFRPEDAPGEERLGQLFQIRRGGKSPAWPQRSPLRPWMAAAF